MEIRAATDSEFEETIDVTCLSFRPDGHERYRSYAEDLSYRREQTRVVIEEGHVVATLRVWERTLMIGSRPLRMGGIGGVCTHPGYRSRGHGSALMEESISYMDGAGYVIGTLFSALPSRYYSTLGWAPVPLSGFSINPGPWKEVAETNVIVEPFREEEDLESIMVLYDRYNRTRSGTLVRPRDYWHATPSRLRGVLPTVVARSGGSVKGYLSYALVGERLWVDEVAHEPQEPAALRALVSHLGAVCRDTPAITEICGAIPHTHPLVDLIHDNSSGTLALTGVSSMMMYAIKLKELVANLLLEWQERLDAQSERLDAVDLTLSLNGQRAVVSFDGRSLALTDWAGGRAAELNLPASFLWRAFLGESSWAELEPAVEARGLSMSPAATSLLKAMLPRREVIFWAPDHF